MVIVMRGRITPTGGLSLMGFMICPEPLYVEHHGIMAPAVMISYIISSKPSVERHGIMASAVMISYIISSKPSVEHNGIMTSAVMPKGML